MTTDEEIYTETIKLRKTAWLKRMKAQKPKTLIEKEIRLNKRRTQILRKEMDEISARRRRRP